MIRTNTAAITFQPAGTLTWEEKKIKRCLFEIKRFSSEIKRFPFEIKRFLFGRLLKLHAGNDCQYAFVKNLITIFIYSNKSSCFVALRKPN